MIGLYPYIFLYRNHDERQSSVSWFGSVERGHLAHWQSVVAKYLPRASQVSASQTIEANKRGKQKHRLQTWMHRKEEWGSLGIGSQQFPRGKERVKSVDEFKRVNRPCVWKRLKEPRVPAGDNEIYKSIVAFDKQKKKEKKKEPKEHLRRSKVLISVSTHSKNTQIPQLKSSSQSIIELICFRFYCNFRLPRAFYLYSYSHSEIDKNLVCSRFAFW